MSQPISIPKPESLAEKRKRLMAQEPPAIVSAPNPSITKIIPSDTPIPVQYVPRNFNFNSSYSVQDGHLHIVDEKSEEPEFFFSLLKTISDYDLSIEDVFQIIENWISSRFVCSKCKSKPPEDLLFSEHSVECLCSDCSKVSSVGMIELDLSGPDN